jgi:hypothetical protein
MPRVEIHARLIMRATSLHPRFAGEFLRADAGIFYEWVMRRQSQLIGFCVVAIILGAGTYGAVMGSWSTPLQALYAGIKLPLVILLTTLGNGLLNGMLAPLLGLNASFRQSLLVVLMTFAIASIILGALSPVALFVVWNTPPLTPGTHATSPEYAFLQLTLAVFVGYAGIAGNLRLLPMLAQWTANAGVARRVLFAWLAGNLFLGSQICWVLRPYIWDPNGPVKFMGREYLHGSFYETVFEATRRLLF